MDAAAVGQPGLSDGAIEDVLAGGFVDGLQRFGARKEEDLGVGLAVVVAEQRQQVVAEQGVALPTALGMGHQQPMGDTVQVFDLNVGGFGEAQAAAINATEEGPGAQVALGADGQELFDFGHAVEPRDQGGAPGTLDLVQERLDVGARRHRQGGPLVRHEYGYYGATPDGRSPGREPGEAAAGAGGGPDRLLPSPVGRRDPHD